MQKLAERIKQADKVAVFMHTRPDGDAIGSAFALSYALERLHIAVQVFIEADLPSNLAFMEKPSCVRQTLQGEFDLWIAVDSSDERRLGVWTDAFITAKRKHIDTVNIDHHVSNTRYAKYNYVRKCAANCMNIASLIEYMGVPLDKKLAEYLLIGLLTDSGNFSHDDVTEETLSLGAKLVQVGADICQYNYQLFKRQSKARVALLARASQGIRYYHDDRFAAIVITQAMLRDCGADIGMTEGFVDVPLDIDGVEVAASLLEMKKGQYKVSLRSKTYADANRIAACFGGGGHVRAAGCMLFGEIEEIFDKLSYTVSQYLEDR